jgi:hypothetical protein
MENLYHQETILIKLNAQNCTAVAISHRNNVVVNILYPNGSMKSVVMHKKYFNQISSFGEVEGRLRETPDGLTLFEGFSFK